MRKVIAAMTTMLCFSLVGCGPSAEEEQEEQEDAASALAEAEAEAEASASAAAAAAQAAKDEAARAAHAKCKSQMGGLLAALKQIDGRLDVGLTYADLGARLGDVAVAYNDIPFKKLDPECVDAVGIPLENAYNEYSKSQNKWDACIEDYACSVEGAKLAELQAHWAAASRKIARADNALASPKSYMKAAG